MCFLHLLHLSINLVASYIHDVTITMLVKQPRSLRRFLFEIIAWQPVFQLLAFFESPLYTVYERMVSSLGMWLRRSLDKGVEILWRGSGNAGWQHHEPGLTAIIAHTERLVNVSTLRSRSFEWLDPSIIGGRVDLGFALGEWSRGIWRKFSRPWGDATWFNVLTLAIELHGENQQGCSTLPISAANSLYRLCGESTVILQWYSIYGVLGWQYTGEVEQGEFRLKFFAALSFVHERCRILSIRSFSYSG